MDIVIRYYVKIVLKKYKFSKENYQIYMTGMVFVVRFGDFL